MSRTWQTANKMKAERVRLGPGGSDNDNFRIKRYVAKYTINPAIANGFLQYVGSVEMRPMFGTLGKAGGALSIAFVSKA
ncbi:hypothetical protein Fmac_004728 [Flemingia macrophylla]|uniref:Urease domain-containing protein n=1 Tax=Flemingia macrophylla TaxID=520843 RepID=A0ABD1N751_9FABA